MSNCLISLLKIDGFWAFIRRERRGEMRRSRAKYHAKVMAVGVTMLVTLELIDTAHRVLTIRTVTTMWYSV